MIDNKKIQISCVGDSITYGIAKQADLPLIDVHSAMTGHEGLLEDDIHPNNEGAMIIANTIYNWIYDTVMELQHSKHEC
ncbi:MAG TPA: hypothetical protein VFD03_03605 [Clostridia bacterium]|nr:hypothetical protein [Clostridia bacterium]